MVREAKSDCYLENCRRANRVLLPIGLATLGIFLAAVTMVVFYVWDSRTNHGLTWGYWGEYNRVVEALEAIPGLKVTPRWVNGDITLEEFCLSVCTPTGEEKELGFSEDDPVRRLRGEDLSAALRRRVEAGKPGGSRA